MAGALRGRAGGIAGLLALPPEQWQAIEADLLAKGFTLADIPHRVTWRAVHAMLRFSGRESAVFMQQATEDTPWPQPMQLQGMLLNQIQSLDFHVRQQTWLIGATNGQKGQPQPQPPKPYEYPGAPKQALPEGTKHIGADPIPAADFAQFWADPVGYDGEEG